MTTAARPILMGVVNVTPDSFSDGRQFLDPDAAATHARSLLHDGAAIIDLGAEASSFFRPGIAPVPAAEQLRRLLPVLEKLRHTELTHPRRDRKGAFCVPSEFSIDTRSAEVAAAVLRMAPCLINDISAGTHDPEMLPTVAAAGGRLVLMHISPTYPANPPRDDADIVATVGDYLQGRIDAAIAAGIAKDRLMIDPGLGFGKTPADNWRLLLGAESFTRLGCPVVLGASRKRFLETAHESPQRETMGPILSRIAHLAPLALHPRDLASAAAMLAAGRGVAIHRVHNVALTAAAMKRFA